MRLTTNEIVEYIENDICPMEWAWESAIELAVAANDAAMAADCARFLEFFEPGRSWEAAEYHGLMYHHFAGRWESAVHIGYIRANEAFQDALEKYEGVEEKTESIKRVFAERTADDAAAEKWIRSLVGTYVFDCADGSVLTFDGIFGGIIDTAQPV